MSDETFRPIEVLVVEDDEADARIARECLAAAKVLNHVTVLGNGSEVAAYLRARASMRGHVGPT